MKEIIISTDNHMRIIDEFSCILFQFQKLGRIGKITVHPSHSNHSS